MTMFLSCWRYEEAPGTPRGYRWCEEACSLNMDLVTELTVRQSKTGMTYEAWCRTVAGTEVRLVAGGPDSDIVVGFLTMLLPAAGVSHWPQLDDGKELELKQQPQLRVVEQPGMN